MSGWRIRPRIDVVILVTAAEDLPVEGPPAFVCVVRRVRSKRLPRPANSAQWFARLQMRADEPHHFLRWGSSPRADEQQIRVFDDRVVSEEVVVLLRTG